MRSFSIRGMLAAALAATLLTPLFAQAGTTGTISGTVTSSTGAPIAGATVTVNSPSQSATATTDAGGRFTILSVAPDTYTVSASKSGYQPNGYSGISVFADQVQTIRIALIVSLKTIASVTSRSSMDLVKQGTTSDVYSVNSAVTQAVQGVGGGGNLNNAYSAIATVPGVFVPPNQQGWDQVVYIRGGSYDQIGYEFDGVPVNRSFDNYPGGTAGTLGQQELQVYAGGGTAGEAASGLAGFINQVIKTGTFPGYASADGGVGTPTYYHHLQLEAGGASPDRTFSYYVGVGGYNQDYRYLDQFNGASLGNVWGVPIIAENASQIYSYGGDYPTCVATAPAGSGYYSGPNASPVYDPYQLSPGQKGYKPLPNGDSDPGCYNTISPAYASYSNIADRETVVNMHFAVPHHKDGGRDDIQLLYDNNALDSQFYSSPNDIGPNLVTQLNEIEGYGAIPEVWGDFITWAPGTTFGQSASTAKAVAYYMPSSPTDRCANVAPGVPGACPAGTYSAVPLDARDGFWNNASIIKAQYQHNIGSSAYLRLYGYTFYSDWLQTSPLSYASGLYGFGVTAYDYELESHTRGLALSFADQLGSKNLLTFNANYTTASTNRFNNTQFNEELGTAATSLTNGTKCFSYQTGKQAPCNSVETAGSYGDPTNTITCQQLAASGTPCAATPAGASYEVTNDGQSGFVNNVTPNFTALSLEDQWTPSDRLNVDVGLRDEIYQFDLANTTDNGQNFWFTAGQNEFCYNPQTLQPYVIPEPPASGLPDQPFVGFNCPVDASIPAHPVQTVHPNGLDGHLLLSNNYSPQLTDTAITPRLGATYTLDPSTVLRASIGRYVQEPETYQVQYNAKDSNLAYDLFQAFWQYGYTSPRHDPLVQYSNNYDFSIEHRVKGTDISFKISPYDRYATNQIYNIALPYGLSGGLNSGVERVDGVELEITKGDFDKNGLSFLLSYTYTNAAERWANFPGTSINPIDPYNQDIANFNGLTKAGGGAKCYVNNAPSSGNNFNGPGLVLPDPTCAAVKGYNPPIANPYYGMAEQPLLSRNGWYPVGLDYAYLSPNTATLVVNYKRNRLAVTPAVTFNEGALYGNPADVSGIDPRTCTANSSAIVANSPKTNPLQADYTSCGAAATQNGTSAGTLFIPDPQTGKFDSFGQFRQPSQVNLSLSMSYELSERVTAKLVLANLLNACFGGSSEPWTKAYPPNSYTCGYIDNYYYISNFYNGTSPNDVGANGTTLNPAFANAYTPAYADTNALTLPTPFSAYLSFQIRI